VAGVVPHHVDAAHGRLHQLHGVADADLTRQHHPEVQHRVAEADGVVHPELDAAGLRLVDDAGVAHLPALFGVEAGAVQQQPDGVAGRESAGLHHRVVLHPADHLRGDDGRVVLRRVVRLRQLALHGGDCELLCVFTIPILCFPHQVFKTARSTVKPRSAAICSTMSM
jgi:hypothetical protein